MRSALERLKSGTDLIVFDSPPLQAVTDSAILSSFTDVTVFVIDARRSRRRTVRLAEGALVRAGANVVGAVLNRIPERAGEGYGPYYGASYGSEKVAEKQAAGSSTPTLR
jgi:Mrp family chromosome partitioning ATPase